MVVLNKIYTRTGDDGTTALGSGARVAKTDARVEAYGTVDETNAAIGLVRAMLAEPAPALGQALARIQNDLFDLGADLCVPEAAPSSGRPPLRVIDAQVKRLEDEIDVMNAELQPLRSFVLPGGSPVAAQLHVARTVCRRAERRLVTLSRKEKTAPLMIAYLNRLSDLLFVLARVLNRHAGRGDVLWQQGKNR